MKEIHPYNNRNTSFTHPGYINAHVQSRTLYFGSFAALFSFLKSFSYTDMDFGSQTSLESFPNLVRSWIRMWMALDTSYTLYQAPTADCCPQHPDRRNIAIGEREWRILISYFGAVIKCLVSAAIGLSISLSYVSYTIVPRLGEPRNIEYTHVLGTRFSFCWCSLFVVRYSLLALRSTPFLRAFSHFPHTASSTPGVCSNDAFNPLGTELTHLLF